MSRLTRSQRVRQSWPRLRGCCTQPCHVTRSAARWPWSARSTGSRKPLTPASLNAPSARGQTSPTGSTSSVTPPPNGPRCGPTPHRPAQTAGRTVLSPLSCESGDRCMTWSSAASGSSTQPTRRARPSLATCSRVWRDDLPGVVMTGDRSVAGGLFHPSRRQIVQGGLGMLLAIVLVVWWLPRIAKTTWSAVFLTLSHVGFGSVMILYGLMCLGLWCYTFTLTGSLPGLRHVHALIVNLCGSSAGNFFPGGGAAGVAVTYAAFRSWGFSRRAISTSIVVTGVWNILARMILPVAALIALLVAGG